MLRYYRKLGTCDGSKLIVGHVDGLFKGLGVRSAERGCFAIGAVEQGISGSDTCIRRRFFVQHDLDKHVEGFSRVLARKLLDAVDASSGGAFFLPHKRRSSA